MAYPRNAPVRIPQNIGQLIEYTNPNTGVAFLRVDPNTGFVRRLTIPVLVQGRRQFVSLLKGKYNQNNAAHVNFATQQGQIFHQILNNVLMGMSAMVRGFDYGARIDFNGLHDDAYRGNKTLPNGNLSTQTLLRHLNVIMTSYTGFLEVQLAHTGISVFGIAGGRGAFVPLTSTCIETVRHTDIHPAKIVQHVSVLSEFATIYGDSKSFEIEPTKCVPFVLSF